jgi:hypothetical protein
MDKQQFETSLIDVLGLVMDKLKTRLASSDANASDITNAIKMLKDFGIDTILDARNAGNKTDKRIELPGDIDLADCPQAQVIQMPTIPAEQL